MSIGAVNPSPAALQFSPFCLFFRLAFKTYHTILLLAQVDELGDANSFSFSAALGSAQLQNLALGIVLHNVFGVGVDAYLMCRMTNL